MRSKLLLSAFTTLITVASFAQEKWDLRKCIEYALANNLSIQQADVQAKIAAEQYKQSKLNQYPSVSFNGNTSFNSGSNQDPSNFTRITQNYTAASLQLQANVQLFNWLSRQNTILANRWQAEAAKATTENQKDNIALDVANAYLQVLLANEQKKIAGVQLQQSQSQLENTHQQVRAGSLPELNATELEAQVAADSANYIAANGNLTQSILALKAYMNIDAGAAFEVDEPPVDSIPLENIADLQPEAVYASAIANLPQERMNEYRLKAAEKNAEVAKAAMYPTFNAFGALGSVFNNADQILGSTPYDAPFGTVTVDGTPYVVYAPLANYQYGKVPFFTQLNQNFRQSIGISLSIPIFSGGSLRSNWNIARLDVKNLDLQKNADNQTLKQNIYQAYNAAIVALEKFNAGKKSVNAAQRSYDFAKMRYDVGMLSTIELITNQNSLLNAKLQYVQDQFDYVFKMKVLEFYKGLGLKL